MEDSPASGAAAGRDGSVAGAGFLVEQVLNEVSFERMVPADLRAEEAASAPHVIGARACGDRPERCCQFLRPPKRGHVQASRRCQLVSVPYGDFDLAKDGRRGLRRGRCVARGFGSKDATRRGGGVATRPRRRYRDRTALTRTR